MLFWTCLMLQPEFYAKIKILCQVIGIPFVTQIPTNLFVHVKILNMTYHLMLWIKYVYVKGL